MYIVKVHDQIPILPLWTKLGVIRQNYVLNSDGFEATNWTVI